VILDYGLQGDFADVIRAWLDSPGVAGFTRDDLAIRIRQHLDACAPDTYLETRALAAATLLDILAGNYAEATGTAVGCAGGGHPLKD
jgi:hypothetical protein